MCVVCDVGTLKHDLAVQDVFGSLSDIYSAVGHMLNGACGKNINSLAKTK